MEQPNPEPIDSLEFFSGIGAFRCLAPQFGLRVVSAFDQSDDANAVYFRNHRERPCARNLDTISGDELPEAKFWWLSPPCTPFTRRGRKADIDDPRARALLNLLQILPEKMPKYFALENVEGFAGSKAETLLLGSLSGLGYKTRCIELCPTQLGIPMQRPRLIYLARLDKAIPEYLIKPAKAAALSNYLSESANIERSLRLEPEIQRKFIDSLNVVKLNDVAARTICFTSGYGKSLKASGSYLELEDGQLRYFSAEEILSLLGFPKSFSFPDDMSLQCRFRLAGNTVDLHCLKEVLALLLA